MFNMPANSRWIFVIIGGALVFAAFIDSYTNKSLEFLSYFVFQYSWAVGIVIFFVGFSLKDEKEEGAQWGDGGSDGGE